MARMPGGSAATGQPQAPAPPAAAAMYSAHGQRLPPYSRHASNQVVNNTHKHIQHQERAVRRRRRAEPAPPHRQASISRRHTCLRPPHLYLHYTILLLLSSKLARQLQHLVISTGRGRGDAAGARARHGARTLPAGRGAGVCRRAAVAAAAWPPAAAAADVCGPKTTGRTACFLDPGGP